MVNYKVSVIMPVYNPGEYLKEALDTIRNQTLKEIEIICVDDGCTDGSAEVLKEYASLDERIVVLQQTKKSNGAALARNMGMEYASGEYLAFVDADDFFEPTMLEHSYEKAKRLDVEILMFGAWKYDNNFCIDRDINPGLHENYLPDKELFSAEENADYIFQMTDGAAWGKLFKLQFVKEKRVSFDNLRYVDDAGFTFFALCQAQRIGVLKERLMHYRSGDSNSQTLLSTQYPEVTYSAAALIKQKLEALGTFQIFKRSFMNWFLMFARVVVDRCLDPECMTDTFNKLKTEYFGLFGVGSAKDSDIYVGVDREFRNNILECDTPLEYLLKKKRETTDEWAEYSRLVGYAIQNKITAAFAIYGAGAQGKRLYNTLRSNTKCRIVGWFDQNYQAMGFPIQSPEKIKDAPMDYLLIAIKNKEVAKSVKQQLVENGLPEEKIICIFE